MTGGLILMLRYRKVTIAEVEGDQITEDFKEIHSQQHKEHFALILNVLTKPNI